MFLFLFFENLVKMVVEDFRRSKVLGQEDGKRNNTRQKADLYIWNLLYQKADALSSAKRDRVG